MWYTLESDPNLFTSLFHDYGATNLFVNEIFDLNLFQDIEKEKIVGFIFLFKHVPRKSPQEQKVLDDFCFLKQKAPNSCASIAVLNLLVNLPNFLLNENTRNLKHKLENFDCESRSSFISSNTNFRQIHNKHACEEVECIKDMLPKSNNYSLSEAFHFSTILPFKNENGLVELDGLRDTPIILHETGNWLDLAKQYFLQRMVGEQFDKNHADIRFSLFAVQYGTDCEFSTVGDAPYSHNYIEDINIMLKELCRSKEFKRFI